LPAEIAVEIKRQLLDYTFAEGEPNNERLHTIFAMLNEVPPILVVFNHPVWDIEMIGQEGHDTLLESFIAEHSQWLHSIEINGFRPWSENRASMAIAEHLGMPMISGGDRHCLHSNTMINVTDAASFSEFAEEIRVDKYSHVVVMPEYHEPLVSRQMASMAEIMGYYPDFPEGRRHWYERVYFDADDATGVRSLWSHWAGREPIWQRWAIGLLTALGHRGLQPLFQLGVDWADMAKRESAARKPQTAIGQTLLTVER